MPERAFRSKLGPAMERYVAARRAQGCKFVTGRNVMLLLDSYAVDAGWDSEDLGRELVEGFVAPRPGEAPRTRELRASTVRCFGAWLTTMGRCAYVLPRGIVPGSGKYASRPRLLTKEEVGRLLLAAESMGFRPTSPQRHIVMPMLLRTVYCCGLRISEACNLNVRDVDLKNGTIAIIGTKFNKDRTIPVSPDLSARLRDYSARMALGGKAPSSPFFPSPFGHYERSTVGTVFRSLLAEAGIPHYDDGPTLHSLRHSFAVHRLASWMEQGEDVAALLPYLSAYMGHEGLEGTERYLRMTVEMHPALRRAAEAVGSGIIPGAI